MRRNIYIREEDEALFEKAEKLAENEESLSSVIASALREWVQSREIITIQPGYWRENREPSLQRAISFRSIFKEECVHMYLGGETSLYQLYVTEGKNFVAVATITEKYKINDIPVREKIVKATVYSNIDEIPTFVDMWDYEEEEKTHLPEDFIEDVKSQMGERLKPRWID